MKDQAVHDKYEDKIIEEYPNVVGFKADKEDKQVRIYVSEKVAEDELNEEEIVPKELEGYKTDVIEIGEIKAEGLGDILFGASRDIEDQAPGRLRKYSTLVPGISIGHEDITAGTLGCFVKKDGELRILSNAHVLSDVNKGEEGDEVFQPGPLDGGDYTDVVGKLKQSPEVKNGGELDCATCTVKRKHVIDPKGGLVPAPTGVRSPKKGEQVVKSGRTTGTSEGKVKDTGATVNVRYGGDTGVVRLTNQIITTNMSKGGDSGSMLVAKDDGKAVGLLFAGSSKVTIHNDMPTVLDALGVELVTTGDEPVEEVTAMSWDFGSGEVAYFFDDEMLPEGNFKVSVYQDKLVIPRDSNDKK